jgi:hypothetical protein
MILPPCPEFELASLSLALKCALLRLDNDDDDETSKNNKNEHNNDKKSQ